ncbi:MAG: hypothetical protein A2W28_06585 [Gammaproteobacteria bacterium RBG_16_51_14]|nr:MAG: hypothetical protein A2W28_06585 [Gammaproteobacteria bacterium RBG_16_51_14]
MGRLLKGFDILSIFSNLSTILASVGLILATSSLISGLQLVKAANIAERKIHRFNGYTTLTLFLCLAGLSVYNNGIGLWSFWGWVFGLLLFTLKIYIVRRRRRSFKYVSWVGASLIFLWLFLVFKNIPV